MNPEDEEWVRQAYCESERRRCVAKILSLDRKDVVAKGDNYTSELSRLSLRVVNASGEVEQRSVIYKCLPSTELRKKHIAESGLFVVEKRMYTEVLPLMEKIRREKESGEPLWGECYATHNYDSMLLEDLAVHGYRMGERMKGLDYDHCKLVMKSLAKFHALAAVLKQRGELIIDDYEKHFVQKNVELMKSFYKSSFVGLAKTAEEQWKGEWIQYAEKLRTKSETVLEEVIANFSYDKNRFVTLNHGDCWVNNMLFKYGEDGKPVSLRFVDFQVTYYNSPAFDLRYFLDTSTTYDLRRKNGHFLQCYHEHLTHYLGLYGFTGRVPTLVEIEEDFALATVYGLVVCIGLLPLMKMPSKNVPDFEEVLKSYEKEPESIDFGSSSNVTEEFVTAVQFVLKETHNRGLL